MGQGIGNQRGFGSANSEDRCQRKGGSESRIARPLKQLDRRAKS
jgi:hypothetical protein